MSFDALNTAAEQAGLIVMGAFHPRAVNGPDDDTATLILLGTGGGFWPVFRRSAEFGDGKPDPVDRWSKRVIGRIATDFAATCKFPSDGPPYAPFIDWALKSGRAWQSPTGMLVHDTVGLMISYRGALLFAAEFAVPAPAGTSPCLSCDDQPCTSACPASALSAVQAYDVPGCHTYLDTSAGGDCLSGGCLARRACPVSQQFGRDPQQSAFHMKAFHPK